MNGLTLEYLSYFKRGLEVLVIIIFKIEDSLS